MSTPMYNIRECIKAAQNGLVMAAQALMEARHAHNMAIHISADARAVHCFAIDSLNAHIERIRKLCSKSIECDNELDTMLRRAGGDTFYFRSPRGRCDASVYATLVELISTHLFRYPSTLIAALVAEIKTLRDQIQSTDDEVARTELLEREHRDQVSRADHAFIFAQHLLTRRCLNPFAVNSGHPDAARVRYLLDNIQHKVGGESVLLDVPNYAFFVKLDSIVFPHITDETTSHSAYAPRPVTN